MVFYNTSVVKIERWSFNHVRWEILHVDDKKLPYFIDKNDILLLSEQVIFSRGMHLFTSESHNSTGDGRFDFHFITTFSFLASRISKPDGMYPKLLNIYSFIIFVNSVVIKFQWHSIFHVDFYGAADTKNIISDRRVEHFALNIFISQKPHLLYFYFRQYQSDLWKRLHCSPHKCKNSVYPFSSGRFSLREANLGSGKDLIFGWIFFFLTKLDV